jgi:hypothetical protein
MGARKPKLKVIPYVGTPDTVMSVLDELKDEAEGDEILAFAWVVVRQGGDVEWGEAGGSAGFRHHLVSGTDHLKSWLKED